MAGNKDVRGMPLKEKMAKLHHRLVHSKRPASIRKTLGSRWFQLATSRDTEDVYLHTSVYKIAARRAGARASKTNTDALHMSYRAWGQKIAQHYLHEDGMKAKQKLAGSLAAFFERTTNDSLASIAVDIAIYVRNECGWRGDLANSLRLNTYEPRSAHGWAYRWRPLLRDLTEMAKGADQASAELLLDLALVIAKKSLLALRDVRQSLPVYPYDHEGCFADRRQDFNGVTLNDYVLTATQAAAKSAMEIGAGISGVKKRAQECLTLADELSGPPPRADFRAAPSQTPKNPAP